MALRNYRSLAHDDEDAYDLAKGMPDTWEPPEYPEGCKMTISRDDLARLGGDGGAPGDSLRFSAMGEVSSMVAGLDNSRIELKLLMLAGDDGKYFEPEACEDAWPECACLCLTHRELDKLDLQPDCERGDLLHLFGTARLDSLSDTEFGGAQACLQVTELDYEDETAEALEH